MDYTLRQRGLASIRFVTALGGALGGLHARVDVKLRSAGVDPAVLPDDLDARAQVVGEIARTLPEYRSMLLLREWLGREHGPIAKAAFEEVRSELAPRLDALDQGATTITRAPDFAAPGYHEGIEFHRTGSWDGHDYMGFVHGELVLRQMVSPNRIGSLYAQRAQALTALPGEFAPERILELGTGSGTYTAAIAARFPQSRITGCDVSVRNLEQARRAANETGCAWDLRLAAAEQTGFPDGTFDLVTSYALLHELPRSATLGVLAEAHRVMAPGGWLHLVDVQPYAAVDRLTAWRQEEDAAQGCDPYWRDYATADLAAMAEAAGFTAVSWQGMEPNNYPWALIGRKPAPRRT